MARVNVLSTPTIGEALQEGRSRIGPAEARLLLRHVLSCAAVWLETHRDEQLSPGAVDNYRELVGRREAGEPVAYLLGTREFFGREFRVSPAVLIPRPETELLVEVALAKLSLLTAPQLLDLGTGSGCIAVSLALECPGATVSAVDASRTAIQLAQENAASLGARIAFLHGDWFAPLAGNQFDLIVSNPPYIAAGDGHLGTGDLRFEPATALASGVDGLEDIRRIITAAPGHLRAGGWLLLEHGYDQAAAVADMLSAEGFTSIEQHRDLAGILRVSGGRMIDRIPPER